MEPIKKQRTQRDEEKGRNDRRNQSEKQGITRKIERGMIGRFHHLPLNRPTFLKATTGFGSITHSPSSESDMVLL